VIAAISVSPAAQAGPVIACVATVAFPASDPAATNETAI
jgi:hypothetical protein